MDHNQNQCPVLLWKWIRNALWISKISFINRVFHFFLYRYLWSDYLTSLKRRWIKTQHKKGSKWIDFIFTLWNSHKKNSKICNIFYQCPVSFQIFISYENELQRFYGLTPFLLSLVSPPYFHIYDPIMVFTSLKWQLLKNHTPKDQKWMNFV